MADEFSLFTSLRYDVVLKQVPMRGFEYAAFNFKTESPFYMLDFHRDRMLRAATYWKWEKAINVLSGDQALLSLASAAQEFIGASQSTPLRVKIVLSREGRFSFEKNDAIPVGLENLLPIRLPPPGTEIGPKEPQLQPQWTILLDDVNTSRSAYTHFKTTRRAMYDSARLRLKISPTDLKEVLLVNQDDGSIMEGSMTTPYFWRNGRWVTPPVSAHFSSVDGSGGQDGTSRRWALERGIVVEEAVPAESLRDGEECWISNGVRGFIAGVVQLKSTTEDNMPISH